MTNKLVLASNNAHKVEEIRAILSQVGYDVVSMKDIGLGDLEIVEDGVTFYENAKIKAKTLLDRLNVVVLADDSGLEVDALDGAPGVYSARYAGEPKSDAKNNEKLLAALAEIADDQRGARFVTELVMLFPTGEEIHVRGTVEGLIAHMPSGDNGFGYDPLFYVPSLGKTFAELTAEEKNKNSHRARALDALLERLK